MHVHRSSLVSPSGGSVSTIDTDVGLDDVGLVASSSRRQLQLTSLDESYFSDSSYGTDGSSETEISLSQLALPSSSSGVNGVILVDVLALPRLKPKGGSLN